jgi:hypothetical protein
VRQDDFDGTRADTFLAQWRRIAECYLGDFHPLSEHSTSHAV